MKPTSLRFHPGARLGWSAARIRAHELSAPRRKALAPVGNPALNVALEDACDGCGYLWCSCPPCATCGELAYYCNGHPETAPPPKAPDVPAVDGDPWAVGTWLRARGSLTGAGHSAAGHVGVVKSYDRSDDSYDLWFPTLGVRGAAQWVSARDLEPIEPADEREGWRPPAPWVEREPQNYHHAPLDLWVWLGEASGKWRFAKGAGKKPTADYYDSPAQGMCAALGITIEARVLASRNAYVAIVNNCGIGGADAESCARAALDAHAKAGGR